MTETIRQLKEKIDVVQSQLNQLQKKFKKLQELEDPDNHKMRTLYKGEFSIISYIYEVYCRLDFGFDVNWYKKSQSGKKFIVITDIQIFNALEQQYQNEVAVEESEKIHKKMITKGYEKDFNGFWKPKQQTTNKLENKKMNKLSYEEWRKKNPTTITNDAIKSLKIFHGLDAVEEVEEMMRREYELYCKEND